MKVIFLVIILIFSIQHIVVVVYPVFMIGSSMYYISYKHGFIIMKYTFTSFADDNFNYTCYHNWIDDKNIFSSIMPGHIEYKEAKKESLENFKEFVMS